MSTLLRFVGGPADGRMLAIPAVDPPPVYLIPVIPPLWEMLAASHGAPVATTVIEYELRWSGGKPFRADDGAYLYQQRPTSVRPEDRQAREAARRAARSAETRRAADLDETWREILRERPQYPADWRDI